MAIALMAMITAVGQAQTSQPAGSSRQPALRPCYFLTNTAAFKALSANAYLEECDFSLRGTVTLVDTNRELIVLQDEAGALAAHFAWGESQIQVGQRVSIEGSNCYPYVSSFPDYPYRPSGWDIRKTFEAPTDWGDYHLTRMRGWLHPPTTGDYTFWIASDNSSELWLSSDADPQNVKKIGFIPRYGWVSPHEWSRFPSQRSETIPLMAGQTYYIEALQEQTTLGDNISVAWQGPGLKQAVIDGSYLSLWTQDDRRMSTTESNGIVREYWTNYSAGDLANLMALRPFEAALTVKRAKISVLGVAKLPAPVAITLSQPLPFNDNFGWGRVDGVVKFAGVNGDTTFLEISDGQAQIQARVLHMNPDFVSRIRNAAVRIEGVCEGSHDKNGKLTPGILWSPSEQCVSLVEAGGTNLTASLAVPALNPSPVSGDAQMEGFYSTHGVVTFNDRVFDNDYLFVQEDNAAIFVSLKERHFNNQFEVGQWIELGGHLRPGKNIPVLSPLVVTKLGGRPMPDPMMLPVEFPIPGSRDGRWTELEGVVRSVNTNGTLSIKGREGVINLWLSQTPTNYLSRYVDAKLRVQGVLSLTTLDAPLLLIPSRGFVDVEKDAPMNPFGIPASAIADLLADAPEPALVHRSKVRGQIIYQDKQSFFLQDNSGGIRVRPLNNGPVKLGDTVEAVGFPDRTGQNCVLTESLTALAGSPQQVQPRWLDLSETLVSKQRNTLVQVTATLLSQKTIGTSQLLELQEQQRVFTASLLEDNTALPPIGIGSRVRVTGVCDEGTLILPVSGKAALEKAAAGSLNILLPGPEDIVVLSGPPWWTMRRILMLFGSLLTVLAVMLLWVYLLRRRLELQQAARLAFSRQLLKGQESERQRIAVNLHDGLGQNLLVIKNQARLAMQPTSDDAVRQDRLNKISEITSQAIEEVRQITHGLRPYQLDRLGLTQAVRTLVQQASENSSISIASSLDDIDSIFDKESEIHVYRIVQESLNNVLKHSAATEATVVVKTQSGVVSLSIRDNGHGFAAGSGDSVSGPAMGYGITGIRERVRILAGHMILDSTPASGTNITVEIPQPASKT